MFGRKCSSPGYGFVSGILFYFLFFWQPWARTFTVGKHLALRNHSNMGKFSRNTVGKPGPLRRGKRKHLWYRGGLRQAHTIEKVENPSFRLLNNIFTYCPSLWVRTTCHMTAEFVLMLFVCFQGWVIMGKLRVPYGINTLTSWEKSRVCGNQGGIRVITR